MKIYDRIELSCIALICGALAIAVLCGCSATPLNPLDRQLQHAIDAENWDLCQRSYNKTRDTRMASRHDHSRRHGGRHTTWEVRQDLIINNCRVVLGKYWITR